MQLRSVLLKNCETVTKTSESYSCSLTGRRTITHQVFRNMYRVRSVTLQKQLTLPRPLSAGLTQQRPHHWTLVQVKILSQLIGIVKAGMVPVPLWPEGQNHASNADFVRGHLLQLLATSFPNMTQPQVQQVVTKMFEHVEDYTSFKHHCRDFLVQTKEFGSANNEDLFAEERADADAARVAAIPGLMKPADVKDDMGMDD
jgi:hypothetical protein